METIYIDILQEMRRNANLLRRSFHGSRSRMMDQAGGQGRLLTILLDNPGLSQKALSDLVHIRPQSLGEQIGKLEAAGLLERRANPYDKRVSNLYLTEAGAGSAQSLRQTADQDLALIFADMEQEELERLLELVRKLNSSIEKHVDMSAPLPPHGHHGHHGPHGHHGTHGPWPEPPGGADPWSAGGPSADEPKDD